MPIQTDDDGDVILNPLTGWEIGPAAETAVFLQLQYARSEAELTTGHNNFLQLILTPQQCFLLADVLTKQAQRLLDAKLPPGKSPN